jgi:hypothetical protein
MAKALQPVSPSPARAALAEAVQAVRDRADERAQTEAAVKMAQADVERSYDEIDEIETAIKHRPQTTAEDLLARVGRNAPHHVLSRLEDQVRDEEPASSRDLKAKLNLAEEILEDRKRTRDELKHRLEGFDRYDYTRDRAQRAARGVVLDEAGEVIAKTVADAEAAMLALTKARATLGWMQSHRIWGDLDQHVPQLVRDVLAPFHQIQERDNRAARASSAWSGVIDGLLADPVMPLPGVDQF